MTYSAMGTDMSYTHSNGANHTATTDNGQPILNIPSYDMPSYGMPVHANVPMSTSFGQPFSQQIVDPSLSGSYIHNPMANTPSSYAQFIGGLPTSMGQATNTHLQQQQQQHQQPPPPPPPLQKGNTGTGRGGKRKGPAPRKGGIDDGFKQQTVNQLQNLDGQFRAVQDSLSAIQSWLQIPQTVTPVHATPSPSSTTNSTFTSAQGTEASMTSLATQGPLVQNNGHGLPMSNQSGVGTSQVGAIGQAATTTTGNSQTQLPYFANSVNQGPQYAPLSFHASPTYTNAGIRPRMSTGFNIDIIQGKGKQGGKSHSGSENVMWNGNCGIQCNGNQTGSYPLTFLGNSIHGVGTAAQLGQQNMQDMSHLYNIQNHQARNSLLHVDMSDLLIPASARKTGTTGQSATNTVTPQDYTYADNNMLYAFPTSGRREERKIVSGGMPLGWNVSEEIKEAIWADDFVDFVDLLDKEGTTRPKATPENDPNLLPNPKFKKQIRTIRDWDRAFSTYMNLYLRKPGNLRHLPHLITYSNDLKNMAEGGINFLEYDEQFRKERASQAKAGIEPWPWNVFRQDTYNNIQLQAIAERLQLTPRKWLEFPRPRFHYNNHYQHFSPQFQTSWHQYTRRFTPPSNSVPVGFCFDFHTPGKRCMKPICSFRHQCPCGRGPHPVFMCRHSSTPVRGRGHNGFQGRERNPGSFAFRQPGV